MQQESSPERSNTAETINTYATSLLTTFSNGHDSIYKIWT